MLGTLNLLYNIYLKFTPTEQREKKLYVYNDVSGYIPSGNNTV